MKRWEELSRTKIALRCLAAVVSFLFVVLGIYAVLNLVLFCCQRERDIEFLRAMDVHVRFAYMITADDRVDPSAPPNGPELLNRTRLYYAYNDIAEIYPPVRQLSDQEVRELIPILGRFRGLKKVGILWSSPIDRQTITALKKALPLDCRLLKLDGSSEPDEWLNESAKERRAGTEIGQRKQEGADNWTSPFD